MSLQIKQSVVNALKLQSEKKTEPVKQEQESKPQIKEHCSSKVGKALRGMALGLMMAAGVASVGKSVPVNAAGMQSSNNETAVTQEEEANVAKTGVEMAVDEMMEEEGKTVSLHVGNRNKCFGEMRSGTLFENGRNYDSAKIIHGGVLVFYDDVENKDSGTSHIPVNTFDLQAKSDWNSIELKTGTRFEESTKMHGDYVELAEDGRTFNVYNADGEEIGHVKCDSTESYKAKAAAVATGVATGVAIGVTRELILSKKKEKEADNGIEIK